MSAIMGEGGIAIANIGGYVLVVLIGPLGHGVLGCDCYDLLALLAMLVLTTVEVETE